MQQYTGIYLLQVYIFRVSIAPIIMSKKTVTAASGIGHITCRSNNLPPKWPN